MRFFNFFATLSLECDSMKAKIKKTHVKKNVKRVFLFGSLSIIMITVILTNISKTVLEIVYKYQEASALEEKLADLENNEVILKNEVSKLQDPEYLARYAREKYFYSKDGELILRIPTN